MYFSQLAKLTASHLSTKNWSIYLISVLALFAGAAVADHVAVLDFGDRALLIQQVVLLGAELAERFGLVNFAVIDERGDLDTLVIVLEVEMVADFAFVDGLELDAAHHSDRVRLAGESIGWG